MLVVYFTNMRFGCRSPVFIPVNIQLSSYWLAADCGTIGDHWNLPLFAVRFLLSRRCKLAVTDSIVTWRNLYIPQNFPLLLVVIFLSFSAEINHGTTNTSKRCGRNQIESSDSGFIQFATGSETATLQTPFSPPQPCQYSHGKYVPERTFKNGT
jgi:hypothetical protein